MRQLAAVDARDRPVSRERCGEAREPRVVGRVRVLAREDERVAPCEVGAEVARATVVELLRGNLVDTGAEAPRPRDAPVARARVDDDHLDLVVDPLARDRLEAAHEVGSPVLHRDDDRDHGVGYSVGAVVLATQRHGQEREEERAEHDLDAESERRHEQRGLVGATERAEAVVRPLDAPRTRGRRPRTPTSAPPARRPCSSVTWLPSRSSSASRSPIRTRAYVRAKTPSWMTWAPMSVIATKPSIVWICHVCPRMSIGPAARTTMPTMPEKQQQATGNEVEPARAVQEHEAHVAPGVAEAVELRLADPRVVVDRDLADREAAAVRLEDHLGRELHAGRVQVEHRQRLAADRAHPAVGVGHLHAEEDVEHAREHGVPDEAVEERHRVAVDRSLEARSDDEVVAALEAVDEARELVERVRVVRVAHDQVLAACGVEAREIRAPVASPRLGHDDRAVCRRDLARSRRSSRCRRR